MNAETFFLKVQEGNESEAMILLHGAPKLIAFAGTKLLFGGHLGGQNPEATHTALTAAATMGMVELVAALLDAGADLHARGMFSETPLHDAAWFGHLAVATLLINRGAIVDVECGLLRKSPLLWAMHGVGSSSWAADKEQAAVARLLLANGAVYPMDQVAAMHAEFGPYPPAMAELLRERLQRPFAELDQVVEQEVVIGLADISHFAKSSQQLSSAELWQLLQSFYELAGEMVELSGGRVVKCLGDAVLVIFPMTLATAALDALSNLQAIMNKRLLALGWERSQLIIKLHMGTVICGPSGTQHEKQFDIAGEVVNELFLLEMPGELKMAPGLRKKLFG